MKPFFWLHLGRVVLTNATDKCIQMLMDMKATSRPMFGEQLDDELVGELVYRHDENSLGISSGVRVLDSYPPDPDFSEYSDVLFAPGVHLLLGLTGSGKTHLARLLLSQSERGLGLIPFDEPTVYSAHGDWTDLMGVLGEVIYSGRGAVVDSISDLPFFNQLKLEATTGGWNNSFFVLLGRLSTAALATGVPIILLLNTAEPKMEKERMVRLGGKVTSIIYFDSANHGQYVLSSRVGDRAHITVEEDYFDVGQRRVIQVVSPKIKVNWGT